MGFNIVEIPILYETTESIEYDRIQGLLSSESMTREEVYESLSTTIAHGNLINIDNIVAIEYYMKDGEPLEGYCYLCLVNEDIIVKMNRDELKNYIDSKCKR